MKLRRNVHKISSYWAHKKCQYVWFFGFETGKGLLPVSKAMLPRPKKMKFSSHPFSTSFLFFLVHRLRAHFHKSILRFLTFLEKKFVNSNFSHRLDHTKQHKIQILNWQLFFCKEINVFHSSKKYLWQCALKWRIVDTKREVLDFKGV